MEKIKNYKFDSEKTNRKKHTQSAEKKGSHFFHVNKKLRNPTVFEYCVLIILLISGEETTFVCGNTVDNHYKK